MDAYADPPLCLNCTVEEEKILKGIELILSDKLNEAEEYFEAMKPGSFRYSLYHAEAAAFVALISCDDSDIERANALLTETEALACQLAQKYRTHSNIRKMNAAVSTIKSWALGKISKKYSTIVAPARTLTPDTDDIGHDIDNAKLEEKVLHHRFRRARLWALQIQAECYLMSSILQVDTGRIFLRRYLLCTWLGALHFSQAVRTRIISHWEDIPQKIVGAGESWSAIVKVGYNLRRTWGLYQHCRTKLRQLTKEWVAMDGSFDFPGDLKNVEEDEMSSDSDDEDTTKMTMVGFDDADGLPKQAEGAASEIFAAGSSTEGRVGLGASFMGSATMQSNEESSSHDPNHCSWLVLDAKKGVKEDEELYSLRLGLQFGEGAFNLILSLIPSSYQKALEVMRFPADRERGVSLLRKSCTTNHPTTLLASVMLLYYHTAIMGLLPYSSKHAKEAQELMHNLPSTWRSCSLFRILGSRLERYKRHLDQATTLVIFSSENPYSLTGKGNMRKLRCLMLDELGWCLLLQGKFSEAAGCFEILLQESVCFKVHYAFLLSSCLWEASESAHQQAGQLLKELPALVGSKKQQQLTPLEQYALQISSKFIASNQAPLFSALELAALFNGFQFMDKASLEFHTRLVEEVLRGRTQMHKVPPSSNQDAMDLLRGDNSINAVSGEVASRPRLHYEHKWTRSSKMTCRFILGLCQKNLGEIEKADDNFRYVIDNSEVFCGNIVPYSCYELASMLLQQDASSVEGIQLLEQSLSYPTHEFQGRLRLVAGELSKHYGGGGSTTIESLENAPQGGANRVSEQFKEELSLQDSGTK